MGMCASVDILQTKVYKILDEIKVIKTYINDILVLIKEIFSMKLYQIGYIFSRLHTSGLKFNATNCSSGLKFVPCLGCIINQEGIKLYLKKVLGIIDIRRSTTKVGVLVLIDMLQYYG